MSQVSIQKVEIQDHRTSKTSYDTNDMFTDVQAKSSSPDYKLSLLG